MSQIIDFIVRSVDGMGYIGIFLLMFLESSFFPFPSEVVMIPAGYLAYKGEMNIYIAIVMGILGSIAGALFNYYLAKHYGRAFLIKYGRYFFFTEETLLKMEHYFREHGHVSTFSGRLIPVVRQYISLPAGLAKMNIPIFIIYTGTGAGIWVTILALLGYLIGDNQELIKEYLHVITIILVILVVLFLFFYFNLKKRKIKRRTF